MKNPVKNQTVSRRARSISYDHRNNNFPSIPENELQNVYCQKQKSNKEKRGTFMSNTSFTDGKVSSYNRQPRSRRPSKIKSLFGSKASRSGPWDDIFMAFVSFFL